VGEAQVAGVSGACRGGGAGKRTTAMAGIGAELRTQDCALLSIDARQGPLFLVCRGTYDAWTTVGSGGREQAMHRAREHLGRGFAFTAERIAVSEAPWPTLPVLPPPEYDLVADGLVVMVPLPIRPAGAPDDEPTVCMNVVATPADEAAGRELLAALSVRAFMGRVRDLVDLEMGFETGSICRRRPRAAIKPEQTQQGTKGGPS